MAKKHTLNITQGSVILLNQFLASDKWAKDAKDLYVAGKILLELEDLSDEMPNPQKDLDAHKAWVKEPFELVLTEKERNTCQKATKEAIKLKQARASGLMLNPLLAELGLVDDDDECDDECETPATEDKS